MRTEGAPPISVEYARATILGVVSPLGIERDALPGVVGRVLAGSVVAPFDIPSLDNTAMDGFAIRADDVAGATRVSPAVLTVVEDLPAGSVSRTHLEAGQAIRIMTGAPIPDGADAIVIVEQTESTGSTVRIFNETRRGAHIRRRGEDVREGEHVLEPGVELRAGEIGLLASIQHSFVHVWRRPTVAILSTGDELVEIGEPLSAGKLVNSNSHSLAALVREAGGVPTCLPIARDTESDIRAALLSASAADFVVTSGGVSVGDYDYVKKVIEDLGATIFFWRVAMKPGKPIVFARLLGKPFFGLPGNPVSSMVGFHLFVRPAIRKAMGVPPSRLMRPEVEAMLENDVRSTGDRQTYLRARVVWRDGALAASTRPAQGSGVLSSMLGANGLVIVPEGTTGIAAGSRARVQLIGDLEAL